MTSFIRSQRQRLEVGSEELAKHLKYAELPALLGALAFATGRDSLLRAELRIDPALIQNHQAGLTRSQQEEIRSIALKTLQELGPASCPADGQHLLRSVLEFIAGGAINETQFEMLREELALSGSDAREPKWSLEALAPKKVFHVSIIGAGMSGLLTAYRLKQAGVSFTVFEKNETVGGTWHENTYPGCRVDVPSSLYSFSFAQRSDWPNQYSPQPSLLEYFEAFAKEFGLWDSIEFHTKVEECVWDAQSRTWNLSVQKANSDKREVVRSNAVISAVGQLNRPAFPKIEGLDSFRGPVWHSAQWRHDVELEGKRVAVIGTGASAAQFCPILAETVAELAIYQRSPNWLFSFPTFQEETPKSLQWLWENVPFYAEFHRLFLFWRSSVGAFDQCKVDPNWQGHPASVSAANDDLRQRLTSYLEMCFEDRPDLLPHVIPNYPPGAKRILTDNGSWAETLMRENVELETSPVLRITNDSIVTQDGSRGVDAIILGTGFRASEFLVPMRVIGVGGRDLHEFWRGTPAAYLGAVVPDFPNFFLLYGPNTNIVVNGSIIWFVECTVRYIQDCIRISIEQDRALSCKPDRYATYKARMDEGNARVSWGKANVDSWYKNGTGSVTQNWPFGLTEFWTQTRGADLNDFDLR